MEHRIRTEFIKRVLQEEGREIDKLQVSAIDKYLHFRTGRLRDDRKQMVEQQSGMDGKLTLLHPIRERFLDIKPKNISSRKNRKRRKAYPIHNRIIFGRLNKIAYKLNYHLTKEVADEIKADLQNLEF